MTNENPMVNIDLETKTRICLEKGLYYEAKKYLEKIYSSNLNSWSCFSLGFLHENNLIENADIGEAKKYYSKAQELGIIDINVVESKIRLAFLIEKDPIPNYAEAQKLYKSIIDIYEQENLNIKKSDIAFIYFRLARIIEKTSVNNTKEESYILYNKSLEIYKESEDKSLDHARVLNKIGWIKLNKLKSDERKISPKQISDSINEIENLFQEAKNLGLEKSEIGILNIKAYRSKDIIQAREYLDQAIKLNNNHIDSMLARASIECNDPNKGKESTGLSLVRRALMIDPYNIKVTNLLDTIIRQQTRYIAIYLEEELATQIKNTIANGKKKGATDQSKKLSADLENIFYPDKYNKASWARKQTYTQKNLDNSLSEKSNMLIPYIIQCLNKNSLIKEQYNPDEDKEEIIKILIKECTKNENIHLIKSLFHDKVNLDQFSLFLHDKLQEFYNNKNKGHDYNLSIDINDSESLAIYDRFTELLEDRYRVARDTIESISLGKSSLPSHLTLDSIKKCADTSLLALNCPPFSYFGTMLGGSWMSVASKVTTDVLYDQYKQRTIDCIKQVDKMLPRGKESQKLMEKISKELIATYGPQISHIKNPKEIENLVDAAIERMMSNALSKTSAIHSIRSYIAKKTVDFLSAITGYDNEPQHQDPYDLLMEGIYHGSSSENRFLRTKNETNEFENGWTCDGVFSKPGVMTDDKRIFGKKANIEKYGCIISDENHANIRRQHPLEQNLMSEDLKNTLNKEYDRNLKMLDILEKRKNLSVMPVINEVSSTQKSEKNNDNKSTNYTVARISQIIGAVLIISAVACAILLSPVMVSHIIPVMLASAIVLAMAATTIDIVSTIYKKKNNYIGSNDTTVENEINQSQDRIIEIKKLDDKKVKGPKPFATRIEESKNIEITKSL